MFSNQTGNSAYLAVPFERCMLDELGVTEEYPVTVSENTPSVLVLILAFARSMLVGR